ncbi:ABC transporter permease subunit [bacterium]|nr:ABC transporter permease subunit [bacterium]
MDSSIPVSAAKARVRRVDSSSSLAGRLRALTRFARNYKLAAIGGFIVVFFVVVGVFAPWLAPKDPNAISVRDTLLTPNTEYWLGTDNNGRDMLSRLIHGARISLTVSFASVGIATALGVLLGILAAWYRRLETVIMRLMDVLLSFPGIIIGLTIVAILGSGLENVILAIAIYQIPQFARLAHGMAISVRQLIYVDAAIATGASDLRIFRQHILPNILAPILVQISLLIPSAIMTSAGLSFLGLGVQPPTPEWGSMLQNSLSWARLAPHVMIFPGLTLMLVVFGFNVLGDGLRDALDPKLKKR